MVRWQYSIVNVGIGFAAQRLGVTLAYFGERGWELVTIFDKTSNWMNGFEKGFILMKKPVPDGAAPDGPWAAFWTAEQVEAAYKAAAGVLPPPPPA